MMMPTPFAMMMETKGKRRKMQEEISRELSPLSSRDSVSCSVMIHFMQNHHERTVLSMQTNKNGLRPRPWPQMKKSGQLYLLLLIPLAYIVIFCYVPMYGATLAFKDFNPATGILGSDWVGLKYFTRFFTSPSCWNIIQNTFVLSVLNLVLGLPFPIILAISLNECKNRFAYKTVQMVTYAPYFISTVIMVALLMQWSSINGGLFNNVLGLFGIDPVNLFGDARFFRPTYIISNIWQFTGFNSIIYLAALSSVDVSMYEAAKVDGASKLQKIWFIDLPSILPTIIILLILNAGQIMNLGFDKVYLMQNQLNVQVSEIIATYTYKVGLLELNFSYSTAIGLLNSVVNVILLFSVNMFSRKISENSLW